MGRVQGYPYDPRLEAKLESQPQLNGLRLGERFG